MRRSMLTSKLTVATYFALVLIPVVLLGYDGPWFGPGDLSIRGRAPFPEKFSPGVYAAFDLWFADRIGFRYPLIYAGTNFHIGLLHRPIDRHIVFGRDGWMFWTDDRDTTPATMADSRGKLRFTSTEVKRIDAQLRETHDRLAVCGIASAAFIAPNKQSIYGEFLIKADAPTPTTRLDALLDELSAPAKAMIVDPRPTMRAAKAAHAPLHLYSKTDTHWNLLGAFYGYLAVVERMARVIPLANRELAALEHYRIIAEPYPGGDMATRVLFSPWRFADENVLLDGKPPISDAREVQIDRAHFVQHNPRGKGRMVLFGDSFATLLVPFLAQHFAEVHRYVGEEFDGAVIALHHPDFVMLETLESYSPRLLLPPINLDAACSR
jgi:alginate O-acetyltransferase complex protein AlgJ